MNGSVVSTGMPLKSEIRPIRSHRGVKAGGYPYPPQNNPLSPKATLPQRGRVGTQNRPEQARSKPGTSQNQARTKSEPTRFAPAPLYHPHSPSPGPLDHPHRGSQRPVEAPAGAVRRNRQPVSGKREEGVIKLDDIQCERQ